MFYSARRAQEAADAELSASRSGIDETEEGAAAKLAAIRDGLARGLSPQQIAATTPGLSASTVYRWVDAGYDVSATVKTTILTNAQQPIMPTQSRHLRQRIFTISTNAGAYASIDERTMLSGGAGRGG